ncbi:MAG: AAA family ATPase [Lachnospiraceae bacterium]
MERLVTDYIIDEVKKVIIGKDLVIKKILMAMMSGGNVLLEDQPGVGKTSLAMALGKATGLYVKRIQFTPDVMPSDVTGFSMINPQTGEFEYVQGAAVTNILLADEINRTSPKTQSALLEIMEEKQVTVDGVTRKLPKPFFVIATQNPYGSAGTNRLPESQMDRFMVRLSMGYPDMESEYKILTERNLRSIDDVKPCLDADGLIKCMNQVKKIHIDESITRYVTKIANYTRSSEYLDIGMSTRACMAIVDMAKASAYIDHRNYVLTRDIQDVIFDCTLHRLRLSPKSMGDKMTEKKIMSQILREIPVPSV